MIRRIGLVLFAALVIALPSGRIASAQEAHHWSYSGETGPDHWGTLEADFGTCASGQEESPIDIPSASTLNSTGLEFHYAPGPLTIVNNGHTIQVNVPAGSSATIDGQRYDLAQFHFHNPSEHLVDGQNTPLELHLVHKNAAGGLAVVGVFIKEGAENAALKSVFDNLPAEAGDPKAIDGATVDPGALLPADHAYWRYNGSLTTPPCSEGVKWHVMKASIEASAGQIAAFKAIYSGNARPVLAMNARTFLTPETAAAAAVPAMLPKTGTTDPLVPSLVLVGLAFIAAGIGVERARREAA
ncbi:MAG: carbonic anhydrase family protein [Ardenticatenales bacterium]